VLGSSDTVDAIDGNVARKSVGRNPWPAL